MGGLQDLNWNIGKEFDVIDVSIDPNETPALAAAKKKAYVRRYGRRDASSGWQVSLQVANPPSDVWPARLDSITSMIRSSSNTLIPADS